MRYDQAKDTSRLKFFLAGVKREFLTRYWSLENTHMVVGAYAVFDTSCVVPCFAWTLTEPDLNLTLAFSLAHAYVYAVHLRWDTFLPTSRMQFRPGRPVLRAA